MHSLIGLSWAVAAIYWSMYGMANEGMWRKRYKDEPWYTSDTPVGFAVPAGDLAYSVAVFCSVSLTGLVILVLRRQILGFELGGPVFIKWVTFVIFVGLWFTYLGMSIANASA